MTAWNRSVASLYSRLTISAVVVGIKEYNDLTATFTNLGLAGIAKKFFAWGASRNSKVLGASAVQLTSKATDHEHRLTIDQLYAEASGNRPIQVRISRDIRNILVVWTIHRLPSVSQWNARIRAVSDAQGCRSMRKRAESASSITVTSRLVDLVSPNQLPVARIFAHGSQ
jgi:hypothetical protein